MKLKRLFLVMKWTNWHFFKIRKQNHWIIYIRIYFQVANFRKCYVFQKKTMGKILQTFPTHYIRPFFLVFSYLLTLEMNFHLFHSNKQKMKEILNLHIVSDRVNSEKIRTSNNNQVRIKAENVKKCKNLRIFLESHET